MEKTELLEALEDSRQELLEMLQDIPDEVMLEPGVAGDWSLKDVLVHLTHWEGQCVTLLFQAKRGAKQPTTVHFGEESADALNARWVEQSKQRPLDVVWSDFTGVRKQTIRRVEEFDEKDLNDPQRFAWLGGRPLWEWIVNDTLEHEEEHADQISDWLDRRDARNNGGGPA